MPPPTARIRATRVTRRHRLRDLFEHAVRRILRLETQGPIAPRARLQCRRGVRRRILRLAAGGTRIGVEDRHADGDAVVDGGGIPVLSDDRPVGADPRCLAGTRRSPAARHARRRHLVAAQPLGRRCDRTRVSSLAQRRRDRRSRGVDARFLGRHQHDERRDQESWRAPPGIRLALHRRCRPGGWNRCDTVVHGAPRRARLRARRLRRVLSVHRGERSDSRELPRPSEIPDHGNDARRRRRALFGDDAHRRRCAGGRCGAADAGAHDGRDRGPLQRR